MPKFTSRTGNAVRTDREGVLGLTPLSHEAAPTSVSVLTGPVLPVEHEQGDVFLVLPSDPEPATVGFDYEPDNPDRGFFAYTEARESAYAPLTPDQITAPLVFRYFVLDESLHEKRVKQSTLDLIAGDLQTAEKAGARLIARFCYSTSGNTTSPPYQADPTAFQVLIHIKNLAPVLNKHRAGLFAAQGGFIGMWGEQYYTDNFGDLGVVTEEQWRDRDRVHQELIDLLHPEIFIQIRTVEQHYRLLQGVDQRRVGFHNDAFLAPFDDYGTYNVPGLTVAQSRAYFESVRGPVGGESAAVNPPDSEGPNALVQAELYHWTYLNPIFHPGVLASWTAWERTLMSRRLGYRLEVGGFTVDSGGVAYVTVTNVGFSVPCRERDVAFEVGGVSVSAGVTSDSLLPGSGVQVSARLPDVGAGLHEVSLIVGGDIEVVGHSMPGNVLGRWQVGATAAAGLYYSDGSMWLPLSQQL